MRFEIVLITVNTRVSKVVADHDHDPNTMKIYFLIHTINSQATEIIFRK